MEREVFVYVDLSGKTHLVGRLWTHDRKGRQSASFEYDDEWLANAERFALDPALQLSPGPFHTVANFPMFGAIGDSAPDRWGRMLMRRAERRRAEQIEQTPRTLREIDYLLLVNDEARQGALRFAEYIGGPFLAADDQARIPPLVDLQRLLNASARVIDENEDDEDIRLLIAPGSSLGGARPKASIRDRDGSLAIGKFPHKDDEWDTVLWEAVSLTLADSAGVSVPRWRLEFIEEKPVLLSTRFDRTINERIPFLSALSMLGARDHETHSYLEMVDALRQHGAQPIDDMHELWRRIVLTVLISNVDDHLRNHGFLYTGSDGWVLSPAYDLNPVPVDIKPRVLSTAIDFEDQSASLELTLSVAPYFELEDGKAIEILREVANVVSTWRTVATGFGLENIACERMKSAFEHKDLEMALAT